MSIDFGNDIFEDSLVSTTFQPEDNGELSLRPHTLKEYIGQAKAKENLYVFIEAARRRTESLDHVLLHGPPGLGKTTLAGIIAAEMGVNIRITSGPAIEKPGDLAALLTNLQENDILFVDEIHRFNKGQQDYLLPYVEDGTIILIGATTENPYFEVNKALISRSTVFKLEPLRKEDVEKALNAAIKDKERGLGNYLVEFEEGTVSYIAELSKGDVRKALNILEMAVKSIINIFEILLYKFDGCFDKVVFAIPYGNNNHAIFEYAFKGGLK